MIERLREVLANRKPQMVTTSGRKIAAVLIPLYMKDGQWYVVFMQRTDRVMEHKKEICFPGGSQEESDSDLLHTALREAEEEVGIRPGDVTVLGQLNDMATIGTRYVISPFVGVIPWPYTFRVDNFETEELVQVPLPALMKPGIMREGTSLLEGRNVHTYFYDYHGKVIWGATARIVKGFLDILDEIKWDGKKE